MLAISQVCTHFWNAGAEIGPSQRRSRAVYAFFSRLFAGLLQTLMQPTTLPTKLSLFDRVESTHFCWGLAPRPVELMGCSHTMGQ